MGTAGDLIRCLILGNGPSASGLQGDLVGRLEGSDVLLPLCKLCVFWKLQSSLCFSLQSELGSSPSHCPAQSVSTQPSGPW